MSDYFIHSFRIKRKSYFQLLLKFQRKILSSFKDIASYKLTRIHWDNGENYLCIHQVRKAWENARD